MADIKNKVSENIDGVYYVDNQCIGCGACITEAPLFFKMQEDKGYAFVFKQPINEAEIKECENAVAACPVEAIGSNGQNNL